MNKFPVIIIDDLYGALEDTAAVIQSLSIFEILGKFTSVKAAELFLLTVDKRIHTIFCDIEMPECSGLDAVTKLRGYGDHLVFITGYADKYALKGHRVHVDGFLCKPVDADELRDLVQHWRKKAQRCITAHTFQMDQIERKIFLDCVAPTSDLHRVQKNGPRLRKHPENQREYGQVPVALSEIAYVEKMNNYIHFYALRPNNQFALLGVLNRRLRDIDAMLQQDVRFVRINLSVVVNMNYVTKVYRDGIKIGSKYRPVSRSRAPEFQRRLNLMNLSKHK